ncbi:response regulator transcription factor [Streptomyces corynorhini]|uniref:DNA-binding response regulator n=1 Tax=Streptomyces corynorhini TaxID=2282652 RepID=A0A370AS42_9ACTN|nr:response regulator transcription factor [Streptomyces corynorhini]RDG32427.1 DNA-binding response regulator [Streptomyces corynorhini]
MTNVLVVERNASAADAMVSALRRQGYTAHSVETGARALRMCGDADLVLIALELPDIDGVELCRSVRNGSDTPLIAVTDVDDELARVLALKAGADDCVVTAWGFREIGARIEAVLRRTRPRTALLDAISLSPLHIDPRTRQVHLYDELVDVTSKEFELLYTLAATAETVVTRRELMAKVWGSDWAHSSRTIDTHVSSLRAKLGSSCWIITVRGVGYRMGHTPHVPKACVG